MKDIIQLQNDLQMLAVRIMDDKSEHCGSGFLYIHDEKNVFVLTAAHVLGAFADGDSILIECHPDPMPANKETEETDKYVFSISRKKENVQIPDTFIQHDCDVNDYDVHDAAVIKLDISGKEDWLLERKRAKFAPEGDLENKKVAGVGYPRGRQAQPNVHMAAEKIDPTRAICEKHNLKTAADDSKHEVEWKLHIDIADPYDMDEFKGWSGCVLALAETNEITLAGVVWGIYPGYKFKVFRGMDMHFLRKLLEDNKWVEKVNEATPTPDTGNPTEAPRSALRGPVINTPVTPPVSDFNLRCVRNMLEGAPEGSSWAHMLRDGMNRPDVVFGYENELGTRMLIETFTDDDAFLKNIFPKEILDVLDVVDGNKVSNDQIMNGTYSDEVRNRVLKQLVKADGKAIDGIISNCSNLMKCPGWERSFCSAQKAFFALMGNEVRQFRYDVQACMINSKSNDKPVRVLAMFIVYTLLGAERFGCLSNMLNNKPIEKIFG